MADKPYANPEKYDNAYGSLPGATPQYAVNDGKAPQDYKETTAKLFLSLDSAQRARLTSYVADVGDDQRTAVLAELLASNGYIEFLLQRASHGLQEKLEIAETLADRYAAYAFGQTPPSFSYQVALLNGRQDDQAYNFFRLYHHVLRAIQMARLQCEVHLQYSGMVVSGVMTSLQWELQGSDESVCYGAFNMLVRKVTVLGVGGFWTPVAVETAPPSGFTSSVLSTVGRTSVSTVNVPAPGESVAPQDGAAPPSAEKKDTVDDPAIKDAATGKGAATESGSWLGNMLLSGGMYGGTP